MMQHLYEIHYNFDGSRRYTTVRAGSEKEAVKRFEHLTFNNVQILYVEQVVLADAAEVL